MKEFRIDKKYIEGRKMAITEVENNIEQEQQMEGWQIPRQINRKLYRVEMVHGRMANTQVDLK